MKTRILLISGCLAAALAASADVLTPAQALQRIPSSSMARMRGAESVAPRLAHTVSSGDLPACYVYNVDGGGSFVLSADDCAPAVLGYSDQPFDDSQVSPGLRYWLDAYASEIAYARQLGLPKMQAAAPSPDFDPITPMTKTKWDQGAPFNNLCPTVGGKRCVTGCVATALAQVMAYHKYPDKGSGSYSYACNGETLSVDFGHTRYDWDKMLDAYSSSATAEQDNAVATLMYSCGVAVRMQYGTSESGASTINVPTAMVKYFGYDKGIRYMRRDYYGLEDWQRIVYDQLKDYGPVQYSGESSDGGHSFVCDGYDKGGYFHINWGWGGMSDGYFLLTALDPETQGIGGSTSGYNYQQDIIANVSKPREGSVVYEDLAFENDFAISTPQVPLGQEATVAGPVFNISVEPVSGCLGLKFTDSAGRATYVKGKSYDDMPRLSGLRSYDVTLPQSLPQGQYSVSPVFMNSRGQWQDVLVPMSCVRQVKAEVSGGMAVFETAGGPSVEVVDMQADITPYYIGCDFEITAKVHNNSQSEYYGAIVAGIVDQYGNLNAYGDDYPIDLMPGESVDVAYVSSFDHAASGQQGMGLQPGQYTLCFFSGDLAKQLSQGVQITLNELDEETQAYVSSMQLAGGGSVVADKGNLRVEAQVECQAGYFASSLTLAIFPYSSGNVSSLAEFTSAPVFISAGQSQTVEFAGDFAAAQPGKLYMAFVYQGQNQLSQQPLVFTVGDESGISAATADADDGACYTISGLRLKGRPSAPGLYIQLAPQGASKMLIAQ